MNINTTNTHQVATFYPQDADLISSLPKHVFYEIIWKAGEAANDILLVSKKWNALKNDPEFTQMIAECFKNQTFGIDKWASSNILCDTEIRLPFTIQLKADRQTQLLKFNPGVIRKELETAETKILNCAQLVEHFGYSVNKMIDAESRDLQVPHLPAFRNEPAHWILVSKTVKELTSPPDKDTESRSLGLFDHLILLMNEEDEKLMNKTFLVRGSTADEGFLTIKLREKDFIIARNNNPNPLYQFKAKKTFPFDSEDKSKPRFMSYFPQYDSCSIEELKTIYEEALSQESVLKSRLQEMNDNEEPLNRPYAEWEDLRCRVKGIAYDLIKRGCPKEERKAFREMLDMKYPNIKTTPFINFTSFDNSIFLKEVRESELSDGLSSDEESLYEFVGLNEMFFTKARFREYRYGESYSDEGDFDDIQPDEDDFDDTESDEVD